ncbi:MAG: nitroreductase [Anaerocolumna sp.]|nr:nitroreductase [Anaerocolumna sp.]
MSEINEVLEQLNQRKSVRVFEDKEVPRSVKEALANAALQAPTAGNMTLYTIIDVTDVEIKNELSKLCDNQPFIAKAPVVFIFVADYEKWHKTFLVNDLTPRALGTGDLMLAASDAIIAAQNTVVAAQSLGLGSCYIGDIIENSERVKELLHLPKCTLPVTMLVYGYPTKQQIERNKPSRIELRHLLHENTYRSMEKKELNEMYEQHSGKESLEGFFRRKFMSDFSVEMNRSVDEYLKDFSR